MSEYEVKVDARMFQPKDKHPVIFDAFLNLKSSQKMELTNDHDPKPLYYQMSAEYPDTFDWEYLEEGPEVWKVAITKK